MVRRPRAALSPFTASPVAIHHSGRLGGGRTASNVPHTPNTKRPARGAFLWERERPARKSAGTLGGSGKTDDCDGCDAGAMNRSTSPLKRLPAPAGEAVLRLFASAPYGSILRRRGAIYCALMGYIQGWGGKRGTTNALPHKAPAWGAFYGSASVPLAQPCGQDARLRARLGALPPSRLRRDTSLPEGG